MKAPSPKIILILLGVLCVSLATLLQPRAVNWSQRGQDNLLKVLLGDGRKLFANHFFTKADVYFHSGYYPSIFYQGSRDTGHMSGHEEGPEEGHGGGHEEEADFLGKPRDWVERFGRHFMITAHTHLSSGREREILPWLKLSAELDPQRIETYTVAAYWLANHLNKTAEAEQFLREGLRANPNSYEIFFELGRLAYEKNHDRERARNVWELALRRWQEQDQGKKESDRFGFEEIVMHLARLEEDEKHFAKAIDYLEMAKQVSPAPAAIQKQINELKQKMATAPPAVSRP